LAALVGVSPAQLSGLLERLAERDCLVGRRPSRDRRRQYWKLLPAGEGLLAAITRELTNRCGHLSASLPPHERHKLLGQLDGLSAQFSNPSAASDREAA
jgi:DNA-binding MarR family transcriptional regulator